MEQYVQLSGADQVKLAASIKAVREKMERLSSKKTLSETDVRKLRGYQREYDQMAETLVGSSFRLVLLICRELAEERHGRERAVDVMSDLVGEANVALVEAILDFDVERCPIFATYAARVIRDRVRATLGKDGPIRLPPSWNRLKRIAAVRIPQLQTELGRPATREEIYNDLLERCMTWAESKLTEEQQKLPKKQRREVMTAKLRKQGMIGALDSLDDVLQAAQGAASLDAQVGAESGTTLGDMLSGESRDTLLDDVEQNELTGLFAEVLSTLDDRERQIVVARYGLDGREAQTYVQIGDTFGVTAERVRQIERAVLIKIKDSEWSGNLGAYLYE
jgi:RNA polymerase nonessential primary-like sigma factor